jgi:hypothetical protein
MNPGFVMRHAGGRNLPRLVCAACGDYVTDVEAAGVVWAPEAGVRTRRRLLDLVRDADRWANR